MTLGSFFLTFIIFSGTVPYSQVPKYISCMDVGLIPFKENAIAAGAFPLKLLEYLACQVPVISTRQPGIEKVAGNHILYANTGKQIRESIEFILQNPAMIKKELEEGSRMVKRLYSWDKIVVDMERILQQNAVQR